MAKKTLDARMTDTLDYLKDKLPKQNYVEIENLVPVRKTVEFDALAADLSIGNTNPMNKSERRAKRSLMLLASLFIEDAKFRGDEVLRVKNLPDKGEADLLAELQSWFSRDGVADDEVASLALRTIDRMPNWNNINVDPSQAVRGAYNKTQTFNCYNACVFWAFQAGAISKRFLWNKLHGKDGNAFFPIYSRIGWDTILENSGQPARLTTDLSNGGEFNVPIGRTVYFETPTKLFGHVALSLGDGRVISQNSVGLLARPDLISNLYRGEVDKMLRAITHIISIRELVNIHFHLENGYKCVKVTKGPFYEPFAVSER